MVERQAEHLVEHREHMRGGNKTAEITQLFQGRLPEKARLFGSIRLVPGASIGVHTHEHETELFFFYQGSGVVTDDGERVPVQAGDAMSTPSGHSHGVENTGTEDLVFAAVIVKE